MPNILGSAFHHMITKHEDYGSYVEKLNKLKPTLVRLSKSARVVWLNQAPTLDFDRSPIINIFMHTDKLLRYNQAAKNIFRCPHLHVTI